MKTLALFLCLAVAAGPAMAANAIQDLINQAISDGKSEVIIPAGTYRVDERLRIADTDDFTIFADDVTMVLTVRTRQIDIDRCSSLAIKGMTLDHDPLPFTQATITAHASDWSWVEADIHEGYPQDPGESSKVEVYDGETGRLIPGVWTVYGAAVEKLTANTIRVNGTGTFEGAVKIGDKITVDCDGLTPHGVVIDESEHCVFENVTQHTSTTFGLFETNGLGNRYTGIRIVPGPSPVADGEPRLKSTNADAIHSKHATLGPVIENCTIISPGDDGVAINGDYDVIIETRGDTVVIASKRDTEIQAGDTIRSFSTGGSFNFEAMVTGISPMMADTARLNTILAALDLQNPSLFQDFHELILAATVSANPGSPVCAVNRKGNGYIVRNNYIGNKRARGILIKAGQGLIEGNTIEWNHMGAIVLSPELYWMEAGFARSVIIRNNILRHCSLNPSSWGTSQAGVITVSAAGDGGFAPAGGHMDIEISGNRIDSSYGVNILATSIEGLTISGNQLTNTHIETRNHGRNEGVNPEAAVQIINCTDVMLSGNIVDDFGGTALLETSNVNGITGADSGISEGTISVISGFDESMQGRRIRCYPNPTPGHLAFSGFTGTETVTVYDASGAVAVERRSGRASLDMVDLSGLKDGMYYVEVVDGMEINRVTILKAGDR